MSETRFFEGTKELIAVAPSPTFVGVSYRVKREFDDDALQLPNVPLRVPVLSNQSPMQWMGMHNTDQSRSAFDAITDDSGIGLVGRVFADSRFFEILLNAFFHAELDTWNSHLPETAIYSQQVFRNTARSPLDTGKVDRALVSFLQDGLRIPHYGNVRRYLSRYPELLAIIAQMHQHAKRELGKRSYFYLDVYQDPEIDDHYLTLNIRQTMYDDAIVETIDRIAAAYDDEIGHSHGWLLITTDFQHPE